jgi:hypothetical protein
MTLSGGDQNRVEKILFFDSIEFRLKRDFKTHNYFYQKKNYGDVNRIGHEHIDIVMNGLAGSKYKFRNSQTEENLSF